MARSAIAKLEAADRTKLIEVKKARHTDQDEHPGEVAAGSAEAVNEACLDWIGMARIGSSCCEKAPLIPVGFCANALIG